MNLKTLDEMLKDRALVKLSVKVAKAMEPITDLAKDYMTAESNLIWAGSDGVRVRLMALLCEVERLTVEALKPKMEARERIEFIDRVEQLEESATTERKVRLSVELQKPSVKGAKRW